MTIPEILQYLTSKYDVLIVKQSEQGFVIAPIACSTVAKKLQNEHCVRSHFVSNKKRHLIVSKTRTHQTNAII